MLVSNWQTGCPLGSLILYMTDPRTTQLSGSKNCAQLLTISELGIHMRKSNEGVKIYDNVQGTGHNLLGEHQGY